MHAISELSALSAADSRQLTALLRDAVEHGASVGYVLPVDAAMLSRYWQGVAMEITAGEKRLLVLREGDAIVGSVQLSLCTKPNGRHRAEVQKLLVHSHRRREGCGRALMQAVEALAKKLDRTLVVLDTEAGSPAQALYERSGYQMLGIMPRFAASPAGDLQPCAFFYREL
jgi:ribosomal protein S18 acetylase RimI-like enzyme